jgi:hypothetical protein
MVLHTGLARHLVFDGIFDYSHARNNRGNDRSGASLLPL